MFIIVNLVTNILYKMETVSDLSNGKIKVKPALCLDFDGTIRNSKSSATFIKNFQDIVLVEGIEKSSGIIGMQAG